DAACRPRRPQPWSGSSASCSHPDPGSAGQRDVGVGAVGLADVAVALPAADGDDLAALAVGHLDFLDEPGVQQLLHQGLALLPHRRQRVRLPAHHEIAAAHVGQPRLRALQLRQRAVPQLVGGRRPDRRPHRRPRAAWQRAALAVTIGDARALDAEGRDAVAQPDLAEAAHARIALDEIAGAQLEPLEEGLHLLRRARRHTDVVISAAEDGVVPAHFLRDPDGEAVVVDTEGIVVPQQRAVEVLPVKENADLHNVASCGSYHACAAAPNFSPITLLLCCTVASARVTGPAGGRSQHGKCTGQTQQMTRARRAARIRGRSDVDPTAWKTRRYERTRRRASTGALPRPDGYRPSSWVTT